MGKVRKLLGRLPILIGEWLSNYGEGQGYKKNNRVLIFNSELQSKIDGNTYAPATQDEETGVITFDTTHWTVVHDGRDTIGLQGKLDEKMDKNAITVTDTSVSDGTNTFNKYEHPTSTGYKHIPAGGSEGQILGYDEDGAAKWIDPSDNDTKNTAGATDTSDKLFLVGAKSQAESPQTYTHDTAYIGNDGCLYSNGKKVITINGALPIEAAAGNYINTEGTPSISTSYDAVKDKTILTFDYLKGEKGKQGDPGQPGAPGSTPTVEINSDGYWVINGTNTNVKAIGTDGHTPVKGVDYNDGEDGHSPVVAINSDGYWTVDGESTGVKAQGEPGNTPTVSINSNGYWVINGETTSAKAIGTDGRDGNDGSDGNDGEDGKSLSFNWDGTSLGVRVGDSGNYSYTNLKGGQGDPGVGIGSVSLKSGSTSAGSTAIYSVKNTNDVEVGTFSVYNGSDGSNATTTDIFSDSANGLAPAASNSNKTDAETSVGNYYLCADGKYRKLPENAFKYKELGTTSNTACAGNDSRLSDARVASNIIMTLIEVSLSTVADCSSSIKGEGNSGKEETVIYKNTGNDDIIITISKNDFVTTDNDDKTITCPINGYCEVSFMNLGGNIYVRGL